MLKRKLSQNLEAVQADVNAEQPDNKLAMNSNPQATLSDFFVVPLWKTFYDLECELNKNIATLEISPLIQCVYNPVEYAAELHCAYLHKFLDGQKKLVFIGMNPGANGMGQTGIPFGNVGTVRDLMKIDGIVGQPPYVHPKRPVNGLFCKTEEPSGVRIWTLLQRLADGSLETFSRQCFVHNFCPLIFFDKSGKNVTPSELKGEYKSKIRDICLDTTYQLLDILNPEIIVAVGDYVFTCFKNYKKTPVLKMPHPSPRALNNTNWPEKAEKWLNENDLIKYIRNMPMN